jgi:lipoic acid synthetase
MNLDRPPWLVKRLPVSTASPVPALLRDLGLKTVCRSAKCPNLGECWARGTATFMILGEECTRRCRFCAVGRGTPRPPDLREPARLAEAVRRLGLKFVVVTSVTRDDLDDGGASHFVATVEAVRCETAARLEVLVPDFRGSAGAVERVAASGCDVFAHNLETVPRLYPKVRPGADYERSLAVLRRAARCAAGRVAVKSSVIVGLGERRDEVVRTLEDMRRAGCDAVTLGQYLRPGPSQVQVAEYVEPSRFDEYAEEARRIGFVAVASGPFVRSSYLAEQLYDQTRGADARAG